MKPFKDWWTQNLFVDRYPVPTDLKRNDGPCELGTNIPGRYNDVDIVINVSDELIYDLHCKAQGPEYNKVMFWFPMGEKYGMGISSMFGALMVLYEAEKRQQKVLLHCHAGSNRSVAVADAYYFGRTGQHRPDDLPCSRHYPERTNRLIDNMNRGQLYAPYVMEDWIRQCFKAFENQDSFLGGMLDTTKANCLTKKKNPVENIINS